MTHGEHEQFFPIVDGNHGGVSCASCHADSPSFKQFNCLSCHEHNQEDTNATHSGISGYAYTSPACYACHPRGESGGLDHSLFFPIADDSAHGDVGCTECHRDFAPGGFGDNACAQCHTALADTDLDAQHGFVGEFIDGSSNVTSPDCKQCHADSQVDATADHGPFLIRSLGENSVAHDRANCLACHTSPRTDKAWATDFAERTCLTCHENAETGTEHNAVEGYAYQTASCLACHPDGGAATEIEHEAFFPLDVPAVHNGIGCGDCHIDDDDITINGCQECHAGAEMQDLPLLHLDVGEFQAGSPLVNSSDCKMCHAESQVDAVSAHGPFDIDTGSAHHTENCLECHTETRGDKAWAADFAERTCLTCHEQSPTDTDHSAIPGYGYATATCLTCHPDGGPATAIDHEAFFPLAAPAEHEGIGCSDCHISDTDISINGCRQCHEGPEGQDMDALHSDVGEFNPNGDSVDSNGCKACHAESQVFPVADHGDFLINAAATHNRENCLECHNANRADKTWAADFTRRECTTCHEEGETATEHNGVAGYAYATQSCLTCHPDGEGALNIDHAPIFPIDMGTDHEDVSCGECHLSALDTAVNGCQQCHTNIDDVPAEHGAVGAPPGNNWDNVDSNDCKMCHADAQIEDIRPPAHEFRITGGKHNRETCVDCHEETRNDKPWGIDFNPFSCSVCHSQNQMDDKHEGEVNGYAYDFPTCLNCHADGSKE